MDSNAVNKYQGFLCNDRVYYAADANNSAWVYITTLTPTKAGEQILSATYTLPTGSLQAIRANFRYLGSSSSCSTGSFDDHDDLVFAVQPDEPPTFSTADLAGTWYLYGFGDDPSENDPGWSRGTITVNSSGTVTGGSAVDSDGVSSTVTGGSLSIDSNGVVSGSVTNSLGVTSTISHAKMDTNKTLVVLVGVESDGDRGVAVAVKAALDTTPPAPVTDLAAGAVTRTTVALSWTAPGDDGNTGTASSYDIRYSVSSITESNWAGATQASGEPTPLAADSTQSFVVDGLSCGTTYYFALKTSDEVPNTSSISNSPSKATADCPDTTKPTITITSPTTTPTYSAGSSPLTLGGTASDNVGVTQVTWANNRGGSGTASGTTSWTADGIVLHTGINEITVTARDAAGNTGTDTLSVTYSRTFTDDPLTAQVTAVKAVHFTELREAINTLRSNNGVSTFTFTDSTLTAGGTSVKAVHITELRSALNGVYDALSRVRPSYTDSTLTAQQTAIKKAHIAEIRQALRDVE